MMMMMMGWRNGMFRSMIGELWLLDGGLVLFIKVLGALFEKKPEFFDAAKLGNVLHFWTRFWFGFVYVKKPTKITFNNIYICLYIFSLSKNSPSTSGCLNAMPNTDQLTTHNAPRSPTRSQLLPPSQPFQPDQRLRFDRRQHGCPNHSWSQPHSPIRQLHPPASSSRALRLQSPHSHPDKRRLHHHRIPVSATFTQMGNNTLPRILPASPLPRNGQQ